MLCMKKHGKRMSYRMWPMMAHMPAKSNSKRWIKGLFNDTGTSRCNVLIFTAPSGLLWSICYTAVATQQHRTGNVKAHFVNGLGYISQISGLVQNGLTSRLTRTKLILSNEFFHFNSYFHSCEIRAKQVQIITSVSSTQAIVRQTYLPDGAKTV